MDGDDGIGGTDGGSLAAGSGLKAPLAAGGLTGVENQMGADVEKVSKDPLPMFLTPEAHAQGAIEHLWALAKHELSEADKAIVIECRRLLRGLGIRTGQEEKTL